MGQHGYRSNFSAEFGNIKDILAIRKTSIGHGNLMFFRTEYDKVPILWTLIFCKERGVNLCQGLDSILVSKSVH